MPIFWFKYIHNIIVIFIKSLLLLFLDSINGYLWIKIYSCLYILGKGSLENTYWHNYPPQTCIFMLQPQMSKEFWTFKILPLKWFLTSQFYVVLNISNILLLRSLSSIYHTVYDKQEWFHKHVTQLTADWMTQLEEAPFVPEHREHLGHLPNGTDLVPNHLFSSSCCIGCGRKENHEAVSVCMTRG